MRKQFILVSVAAILGISLLFLKKVSLNDRKDARGGAKPTEAPAILSEENVLLNHKNALDAQLKAELDSLDILLKSAKGSNRDSILFKQIKIWESTNDILMSGLLFAQLAESNQNPKMWNEAGNRLTTTLEMVDSTEYTFAAQKALDYHQHAYELDSNNLEIRADYANIVALTDPMPMRGIGILRENLNKDPKHLRSWFLLGTLAMKSNQLDKASERFGFINKNYPSYADAWYLRGVVLSELGKTDSAVVCFKMCTSLVTNPILKKDCENQIENLKK